MVAPLTRALLFVLGVTAVQAELQLVPSVSEYELDGVKFKQLAFRDADKLATYQPPRGWDYAGSSTQLTLRPPGKTQAEATIARVKFSESQPPRLDEEGVKKLVSEALTKLPKDSAAVTVVSQEKNPLSINRHETFGVVLSYILNGQTFNRSILFLNRESEQIQFQFTSRQADFKEAQRAFQSSLYTWQNL